MKVAYLDAPGARAETVEAWMEAADHDCERTDDFSELREPLRQGRFDAVLLNWDLPDLYPLDVLAQAQQNGPNIPVMVTSAKASREEIAEALQQEGCEFIGWPLDRDEFLARLDTIWEHTGLRDMSPQYADGLGPWRVDDDRRVIFLRDEPVELTDKEFELARYFFRNLDKLLTRRELLREVWGIRSRIESRTVDVHVSRLRRRLQLDGRHGYRITTVYHHGYRLEASTASTTGEQ